MEQGWLKAVEELHGQAGLMDDAALEWLLRLWVGSVFSRAINSITMPRGCLHSPIDGHKVLKLHRLHFDCFFKETTHLRALENQRWDGRKGNTSNLGYRQNISTQQDAS